MKTQGIAVMTAVVGAVALASVTGLAQTQQERAEARAHLEAAKKAAGYEVADLYDHTCSRLMVGAELPYGRIVPPENDRNPARFHTEPVKVFDNLYYVGERMQHGATPAAWAVTTSDGIILIDALFEDSVRDQIEGGLKKLGLDPAKIKYIVASHGHADHIAGARYLQDTYHAKLMMAQGDWDVLEKATNFRGPKPNKDIVIEAGGQKLTLGDTTLTLVHTPGHTPGTISMLIPVKDNGTPHIAALWGGTGMQFSAKEYNASAVKFRDVAAKAGADVMLSTHPQLDKSDVKLPLVLKRKPGDPHPYVVGAPVVQAYFTVAAECSAAAMLLPEEYKGYLGRR